MMQPPFHETQPSDSLVNIYFRNSKRQAKLISVLSPILPPDLVIIAANCFHLPQEAIALFYNGFRIDKHSCQIILAERSIVHIVDKRAIDLPQLIVSFRPHWNAPTHKLALTPDLRIRDLVNDFLVPRYDLAAERFFLVYLGRVLSSANELRHEMIEDGCEVLLIMYKQRIETMAVQRDNSHRVGVNHPSLNFQQPVTYKTSLHSLKKKPQQPSSIQQHQEEALQSGVPKPPQNILSFDHKTSFNDSLNPGPLEKSAMMSQKSKQSDKRSSEKPGAGPEIERAAPSQKIESYGSSGSRGAAASAEAVQIKIKVMGSAQKPKDSKENKILELQSNAHTAPPLPNNKKSEELSQLEEQSKTEKESD